MAEAATVAPSDRVKLVYESRVGDQVEQVELPFKLLLLADFTRDDRSAYFEDQQPVILSGDSSSIDTVFARMQPELKLNVANKIQDDDSELQIQLSFASLEDFEPQRVLQQQPWMQQIVDFSDSLARAADGAEIELGDDDRAGIEALLSAAGVTLDAVAGESQRFGWLIADIEQRVCAQLDAILHHPDFRAMERAWRSLEFLLQRCDFSENCEIAVLNLAQQALADDFEDVPEVTQSRYYQMVYSDEFGQFGGRPYGAVVADYQFSHKAPEVRLLQRIAAVSAVAHAPFIAAASAEVFDIDNYSQFSRLRDIDAIFHQPSHIKWRGFQQSSDARYVALALPGFLLREAYDSEIASLTYREKVKRKDGSGMLWGNAAFAFASRLLDSFAQYRWCLNCTGQESGRVAGLEMRQGRIPTQFILTDRRESDVVEQGLIPLSVHKGEDSAAFYSASSLYKPEADDKNSDEISQRLAGQLPYLLIISRLAQYLKVMQRENLGAWKNRRDLDQQLNKWLLQYVSDMDNPAPSVRARRPLRRAEVKVREVDGKPYWFVTQINITPHLKFMGSNFDLSETSKMEKS